MDELFNKGIFGLKNRGNTCFLNTAIQCISNIPDLTHYFLTDAYLQDLTNRFQETKSTKNNEIILTREYGRLIKALWNTGSPIEPKTFHICIQTYDSKFMGYQQHDAHEVLAMILDYMHEGLQYDVNISYGGNPENELDELVIEANKSWSIIHKNKYSFIAELFFGQFINKIISIETDKSISKNFEMFNILNIPIHGATLYDSLAKYFEKEILESKVLNEETGEYINVYKEIKLIKVPKYLVIVLKRYKNSFSETSKQVGMITYPFIDMDLSSYSDGYDSFNCKMDLISIGCHRGGLSGGHYFSICKHFNGKWYKYDDDTVTECNILLNKPNLFREGYILIYKKHDETSDEESEEASDEASEDASDEASEEDANKPADEA
jgi:ubiquitin C-terminal hydrolase